MFFFLNKKRSIMATEWFVVQLLWISRDKMISLSVI